jgi:putative transposase
MTPFDPQIHHRCSIRLKGYDYSLPGAYFITLVTYQRDEIFGEIKNGMVQLSPLGKIVNDEWMRSNNIRREILLYEDEFVIMPNHLHGIVRIVGADGVRPENVLPTMNQIQQNTNNHSNQGANLAPLQRKPKSLSSFIAGFKSSVTNRAERELNMTAIWQRNYYDHIIRNEHDFINIWNYMETNPQNWRDDELHSFVSAKLFNFVSMKY